MMTENRHKVIMLPKEIGWQAFDRDGNPDSVGNEANWDYPIDDISDFKVLTPDDTTLPHLPIVR
jgi:hypothetical protein